MAPVANRVIGSITADIPREANTAGESALGDVIADGMVSYTTSAGAQIGLMNPGGIRAGLAFANSPGGEAAGQVTYGEAFTVQPFNNLVVTVTLTGAQLEEILEGYVGKDYWQMVLGPLLVLLVLFANRGVYSLVPHQVRGVPMFFARIGIFILALVGFVWLMSKDSPIQKMANNTITHLPLYVIFGVILLALLLRLQQESGKRHG